MGDGLVGYSAEDLGFALDTMEKEVNPGDWCQIQLCTESLPSQETLDNVYLGLAQSGHNVTQPIAALVGGLPVTTFNIQRELPYEKYQWQLIIPIIVPVLVIGLITFGIFRIQSIANSILPVLIVAGIIVLGVVIVMAKPAERVATAYIESGKQKLLPATIGTRVPAPKADRDPYSGHYYKKGDQVVYVTQRMFKEKLPPFLKNTYVLPWAYDEMVVKYHGVMQYLPATIPENQAVEDDLIQSMKDEAKASTDYRTRGEKAQALGDKKTAARYEEIAGDEDQHYNQFGQRMRELESEELKAEGVLPHTYQAQNELLDNVHELWKKACEFDKVPLDSKFVVFSENNPYIPQYREAVGRLLRMQQLQRGAWQPSTEQLALVADTEGDPRGGLKKFCCRYSDACAPPELLAEGKFPERIAWLRTHYEQKHPGMWGKLLPETKEPPNPKDFGATEVGESRDVWGFPGSSHYRWAQFSDEDQASAFDDALIENGYKTRLEYEKLKIGGLIWIVKYSMDLLPATMKKPFVQVGDRVRYLIHGFGGKFRFDTWPKDVWLGDKEVDGTVTEYRPELPEVIIRGQKIEGVPAWAVVKWDNGASTAIDSGDEGTRWKRVGQRRIPATELREFLAKTKTSTPEYIQGVIEGNLFTKEEIDKFSGFTGENPLGVKDEEWRDFMRQTEGEFVKTGDFYQYSSKKAPYIPPGIKPAKEDLAGPNPSYPDYVPGQRQFIADSAEYMAETIESTGWRDKIDQAFQEALERVHRI